MSKISVALDCGKNGAWLDIPATADELKMALERIGGVDNPYSIGDYRADITAPHDTLRGIIVGGDVNEANYLAARLASLPQEQKDKLDAVMETPGALSNIAELIDFTFNPDFHELLPGVNTVEDLARHYLHESGLVNMPDHLKKNIDPHSFGASIHADNPGVFTSKGYLTPTGEAWREVFEKDRRVPPAYRIDNNYIASAAFDAQAHAQRLKDAGVSLSDISEELNYRDRAGDVTRWDDNLFEYSGKELSAIEAAWPERNNHLATAEKTTEGNYNQIDGQLNNAPPRRPDLTDGQTHDEIAELMPEAARPAQQKPSILGRLAAAVKEAAAHNGPAKEKGRDGLER